MLAENISICYVMRTSRANKTHVEQIYQRV